MVLGVGPLTSLSSRLYLSFYYFLSIFIIINFTIGGVGVVAIWE